MKKSLRLAYEKLEEYLAYRKYAEYGIFKHWYRGDLKMNAKKSCMTQSCSWADPGFCTEENV